MKKTKKIQLFVAGGFLAAFIVWTLLLLAVDVQAIGPEGTKVGFGTMNAAFHALTGVHMSVYTVTDWLGLVPLGIVAGFGILGLVQWIRRKDLRKIDHDILMLGGFYLAVGVVYVLFELVVMNYRPILIEGFLEASYPSSTTMLAMCVMPTAMMQWTRRIGNKILNRVVLVVSAVFIAFMVIGRLVSGVHWISDIIGGALISSSLVTAYAGLAEE